MTLVHEALRSSALLPTRARAAMRILSDFAAKHVRPKSAAEFHITEAYGVLASALRHHSHNVDEALSRVADRMPMRQSMNWDTLKRLKVASARKRRKRRLKK